MEVDTRQNLQDDQMGDCHSFGSTYAPSSQSRKISIGILVDPLPKKKSRAPKDDEAAVPNVEGVDSKKESFVEGNNKGKGAISTTEGKQTEAPGQASSPWVTMRSFNQRSPTSEIVLHAKETSNFPPTGGRRSKLNRVKDAPVAHSVGFFPNPMSISHSGDGKQKNFGRLTYKRMGGGDRNSQPTEEFKFATAQEVLASDKAVKDDKTKEKGTDTLKMKLWEILGNVSSPKSQPSNSRTLEIGANNLKQEQRIKEVAIKPRQNSDTIETDSENPDHAMKRPVTRSLTRKRASTKKQPVKAKAGPSSSYRQKFQKKNVFSFEEGLFGKQDVAVNGGSSMSTRKKGQLKICSIEPRKIYFTENNNVDGFQEGSDKNETSLPAEKASSHSYKTGNFCGSQNKREYIEPKNRNQEIGSHQSASEASDQLRGTDSHRPLGVNRKDQEKDFNSSAVQENGNQQAQFDTPSSQGAVDPHDDFQSPTFKINTPTLSSPPSSTPKPDQINQLVGSPDSPEQAERGFTVGNNRSFRTLRASKADRYASNIQTESPDVAAELTDSPPNKTSPLKGKNAVEDDLNGSSPEAGDYESPEEGSPAVKGCRERENFSPEIRTAEKSKFMLYPTKRLRNHNGDKVRTFSPISPSPTGIGVTQLTAEPSKQNEEDELERVIMLFVLALENFKKKMKSETRKKASDILMSVCEEIHLLLQNIESQIQTDLGKLTSVSKSKRKRLEMRFHEQQEQLKLIHDKFKQDIYQHLQECKTTLEGLELHQIELKGTVKKQKASHQKLLMQAEEAVETQLNDAQRRITAVHKLGREKMLQLKQVIAECLSEGTIPS